MTDYKITVENDCCLYPNESEHGDRCYCGRRAKWHINDGKGCRHVCSVHKASRLRSRPSTRLRALPGEEA